MKLRRFFSTTTRPSLRSLTSALCLLPSRSVLHLKGADTSKFLQSLTSNDLQLLHSTRSIYTSFLNPKGRYLYDAFLWRHSDNLDSLFIECSAAQAQALRNHLNRFKLRANVTVEDISPEFSVWSVLGAKTDQIQAQLAEVDPRFEGLGTRVLLEKNKSLQLGSEYGVLDEGAYQTLQMLHGIPDGTKDLISGESLPIEANLEWLKAVSFTKGCYQGQELTTRTHVTGIVRKRIMPVYFGPPAPLQPATRPRRATALQNSLLPYSFIDESASMSLDKAPISSGTTQAGQVLSSRLNLGLALLRLEHAFKPSQPLTVTDSTGRVLQVTPYIPEYWPEVALDTGKAVAA
eukprot:TRINITY_DN9298_c0_g1_i7.p1 TRINITY_DN9298_c0_g1~~TRINITY_DN9298_c0_g1_i7.p1  ORF type:complete len:347 (-),score=64.57 TRINITY_DN9298_c0_g1_i7:29-1069(-)